MPTQLGLTPNIKLLLAYSAIGFVFGFFPTQSSQAQTEWTITIDATGNHPKPAGYKVSRRDIGVPCGYTNNDATQLYVCPKDTVLWVASTAPGSSGAGKKKNELFIFHEDQILLDSDGNSVQTLHSSDGAAIGGTIDPSAIPLGHEYYVVVYDRSNKKWYVEDPKIIIGGAVVADLIQNIQKNCDQLSPLIEKDKNLGDKNKDLVREGCKQFRNITKPSN